jgi:hypothetical protein
MDHRRIFIVLGIVLFGIILLPYAALAASGSMKWQEIQAGYYYAYGPSELELGGREVAGDLVITVYDDGKMGIGRWAIDPDYPGDGYQWVDQIYDYNDKGFLVYFDSTGYGSVYYKNASEFVSDSTNLFKSGNSITADFYVNNDLKVTQRVTYVEGDAYLKIEYSIENISGRTLTDLRFFHGEDTYLLGHKR